MSYRRPPRALPERLAAESSEQRRSRSYRNAGPVSFDNSAYVARGIVAQGGVFSFANPAPAWGYYSIITITADIEEGRYYYLGGFIRANRSAAGRSNIGIVRGYNSSIGGYAQNLGDYPFYWPVGDLHTAFGTVHDLSSIAGEGIEFSLLVENAVTLVSSSTLTGQFIVRDEGAV